MSCQHAPVDGASFTKKKCYKQRERKVCTEEACTTRAHSVGKGKCFKHSKKKVCTEERCDTPSSTTGKGKCFKHSEKKVCTVDGCTTDSVFNRKCARHNTTQCTYIDTDGRGRCERVAAYRHTKCPGHTQRARCRHGADDPAMQCRAFANSGVPFCGRHGTAAAAAAAAACSVAGIKNVSVQASAHSTRSLADVAGTLSPDAQGAPAAAAALSNQPRKKRRIVTGCRCGSTSHVRTSHKECPLNGRQSKRAGEPASERMEAGSRSTVGAAAAVDAGRDVRRRDRADGGEREPGAVAGREVVEEDIPGPPAEYVSPATAAFTAAAERNAAARCIVTRCPRSARGHYLCREHSGLYRCTARSVGGTPCSVLTDSNIVGGTCAAHSNIGTDTKMAKGGFTVFSDESDRAAAPVLKRTGVFRLVACAFSTLGGTGVTCTKNGYQADGCTAAVYCKKHRIFKSLSAALAELERAEKLDHSSLPVQDAFKLEDGKVDWDAIVADKLGYLKPDGSIRV